MKKQWKKRAIAKVLAWVMIASVVVFVTPSFLGAIPFVYGVTQVAPLVLADTAAAKISYAYQMGEGQTRWSLNVEERDLRQGSYLRMKIPGVEELQVGEQVIAKDETGWFVLNQVIEKTYQVDFQTVGETNAEIPIDVEAVTPGEADSLDVMPVVKDGQLEAQAPVPELPETTESLPAESMESSVATSTEETTTSESNMDVVSDWEKEPDPTPEADSPETESVEKPSNELMGVQPFVGDEIQIVNKVFISKDEELTDITYEKGSNELFARPGDMLVFRATFRTPDKGNKFEWQGTFLDMEFLDLSKPLVEIITGSSKDIVYKWTENKLSVSNLKKDCDWQIEVSVPVKKDVQAASMGTFISLIPEGQSGNNTKGEATAYFQIKPYTNPGLSWEQDKDVQELEVGLDMVDYTTSFYWKNLENCTLTLINVKDKDELVGSVNKGDAGVGSISISAEKLDYRENQFKLTATEDGKEVGSLELCINVTGILKFVEVPSSLSWSGTVSSMKGIISRDAPMELVVCDSRESDGKTENNFLLTATYQPTIDEGAAETEAPFSLVWKDGDTEVPLKDMKLGKTDFDGGDAGYTYIRTDDAGQGILLSAENHLPVGTYTGTITWQLTDAAAPE